MQLKRNNSPRDNADNTPATVMWPRIAVISSVFLLVLIGLVMVYSASSIANIDAEVEVYADAVRQLGFAAAGVAACLVFRLIPHGSWRGLPTVAFFGISLALLVLTAAIGTEELGAQRWVNIGPVSMQPSEFAKIGILLMVAKLVSDYQDGQLSNLAFSVLFLVLNVAIAALVLVMQSDMGTTLICVIGMIAILWLAEVSLKHLGIYVIGVGVVGYLGMQVGYRWERMMTFLDPWGDYYGTGYQIIHSMYAFAQGGVFGTGLGNSAEKYLYLPEASTDFIYSIIGEEFGLVGALFVLALFVVFLLGGLRMAQNAPDRFGAILCGSFSVIIVFQAFLNIGCVIGVMPVTGKPLPFVSAGGSSLITSLMMVGIMLSVSFASGESPEYARRRQNIRPVGWDDGYDWRESRASGRAEYGNRARAGYRAGAAGFTMRPTYAQSYRGVHALPASNRYSRGRGR